MGALVATRGGDEASGAPVALQACKSFFGHGEPAAGANGLLAAVSTLSHGKGIPILHLRTLNPHVQDSMLGRGHQSAWAAPRQPGGAVQDPKSTVGGCSSFAYQVSTQQPLAHHGVRSPASLQRLGSLPPSLILQLAAVTDFCGARWRWISPTIAKSHLVSRAPMPTQCLGAQSSPWRCGPHPAALRGPRPSTGPNRSQQAPL